MQPAGSDEEAFNIRNENPLATLQRFPTHPGSILLAQLELEYIPALPFIELYEPHSGMPQVVRSSAFRCITQNASNALREAQVDLLGPAYRQFLKLCCLDPATGGLQGVLARQRHRFFGYFPHFQGQQQKMVRDVLRKISDNIYNMQLAHDSVPDQISHALTILDLEQLCLRAPCEEAFEAAVDYIENLDFKSFSIPRQLEALGSSAEIQEMGLLFQQTAFASAETREISLYFKDMAARLLGGSPVWLQAFPSLVDAQLVDSGEFGALEQSVTLFAAEFGVSLNLYTHVYNREDQLEDPEAFVVQKQAEEPKTAISISFDAFKTSLMAVQQQFYDRKHIYLEFLLYLFSATRSFRKFEADVYSQIFEDYISFVTKDGFDYRALTVYLLLASRFAYLLFGEGKRYQFIYDKIVRNLTQDREALSDLEENTNVLDYIIWNMQRFSQGELMLQESPNKQQKTFWLMLKQLKMKGIECFTEEMLKRLDSDVFKAAQARQSDTGLLNKVDCRVAVQGSAQTFEAADLKKFYFNCNRYEWEEMQEDGNIFEKMLSMTGSAKQ